MTDSEKPAAESQAQRVRSDQPERFRAGYAKQESGEGPRRDARQPQESRESQESSASHGRPIPNSISSSISGPGIGDDVGAKRANLLSPEAKGEPQLGRRPSPEPYDPWPTRIMYAKGLAAGAVVLIIVLVILIVAGSMNPVA